MILLCRHCKEVVQTLCEKCRAGPTEYAIVEWNGRKCVWCDTCVRAANVKTQTRRVRGHDSNYCPGVIYPGEFQEESSVRNLVATARVET